MAKLTWLVTGTSSGFGENFVHSILARGDRVIATARRAQERLQPLKAAGAAILELDVSASQAQINAAIQEAVGIYGGIDVVVNNAGFVQGGIVEEQNDESLLNGFRTNFFGPVNVTRAILPHFREKQKGFLIYMSSVGAYYGAVGGGTYCATKGALESMVESIKEEVSPFGIQVCLVIPGYYRTNIFADSNAKFMTPSIPAYAELNAAYKGGVTAAHQNQPGDPRKATDRIVDAVRSEGKAAGKTLPFRLPLGSDGIAAVRNKCLASLKICEEWEDFSNDTKFDS